MPFVLNVAGPRESKASGIQKCTRKFLVEVLQGMIEGGSVPSGEILPCPVQGTEG